MTSTAKHFVCYTLLIGTILGGFAEYRRHLLESNYTEAQLNSRIVQAQSEVISKQTAIESRDKQLAVTNAKLDAEEKAAVSTSDQLALINSLLKLPAPIAEKAPPPAPGPNPSSGTIEIPKDDVPALTDEVVACKECQASLAVASQDKKDQEEIIITQAGELKDCRALVAREPHTRWQRFRKGIKWVTSFGKAS